jgi:hypothetical protein
MIAFNAFVNNFAGFGYECSGQLGTADVNTAKQFTHGLKLK